MCKRCMILPIFTLVAAVLCGVLIQAEEFEKNTDLPPVGHTDPAQYRESKGPHGGVGSLNYFTLVDGKNFKTNLLFFHRGHPVQDGADSCRTVPTETEREIQLVHWQDFH